jgi:uncharacterized membrane protein YdjX (TVP38/TMEM64 family)
MKMKKLMLVLLAACAVGFFFWFDLGSILTLEGLKGNRRLLLQFYHEHALLTVVIFMAIYVIQTALALPGAAILSLSAGVIFGPLLGTVYAVSAASIGAGVSFLFARYLLREVVQRKFGPRLEAVNREIGQRGINYLLFLRLVPVFPFFLINLAAGLTGLSLRTFMLGTFLGIIPGGFVYVNAGAGLASINALGDVASPRVLGSFALLGLFALIPAIYSKVRSSGKPDPG